MNDIESPQTDELTEALENLSVKQTLDLAKALMETTPSSDLSQAKVSRLSSK